LARSTCTSQPIAIASPASDAQDMPLSPAAFPVMFPDQFTRVTGGLVLLVVGLALLVIVAAILAIQATSDTKNQMRKRST